MLFSHSKSRIIYCGVPARLHTDSTLNYNFYNCTTLRKIQTFSKPMTEFCVSKPTSIWCGSPLCTLSAAEVSFPAPGSGLTVSSRDFGMMSAFMYAGGPTMLNRTGRKARPWKSPNKTTVENTCHENIQKCVTNTTIFYCYVCGLQPPQALVWVCYTIQIWPLVFPVSFGGHTQLLVFGDLFV